ncbi:MAG: protein kinase, partial [Candidatus Eisenbacteria bacterium]|nr:protein kinase [Candidatus Eisenbacteria bacterium]
GFQITERLGAGAMGTVYRAVQSSLGRVVVIKTLHPHLAADEDLIARFEREARHAAHLQHQNTVQVIEFGREGEVHYIAMEYVEGMDLKELLHLSGPFPIAVTTLVLRDVCRGLEAAHARDIVHRDIKPANLMITSRGVVKVMDFGLARETAESSTLTAAGSVMGSPAYMSPEQARGESVLQASDIFSAGLVGFELLTGTRAFGGDSYPVVLHKVLNDPIPPVASLRADVPEDLAGLIEWMTQKELPDRCPSMSKARDLLEGMAAKLALAREDALLGEFVRTGLAERERRNPKPQISEAQSQAQTVATSKESSGPTAPNREVVGTVVSGGTVASGAAPTGDIAAVESSRRGTAGEMTDSATASREASGPEAAAPGPVGSHPGRREGSAAESGRDSARSRKLIGAIVGVGLLLVAGVFGWNALQKGSSPGSSPARTDPQEIGDGTTSEQDPGNTDATNHGPLTGEQDRGALRVDRATDRGQDPADSHHATDGEARLPADDATSPENPSNSGDNPSDESGQTRGNADASTNTRGGSENRSDPHTGNSSTDRSGGEEATAPFRQEYSISTSPGFAFIRLDGDLINGDGNIPVKAVLREGRHIFQLNRSNGEDLGALEYTVARGDPNRVLILKFREGLVEARPR